MEEVKQETTLFIQSWHLRIGSCPKVRRFPSLFPVMLLAVMLCNLQTLEYKQSYMPTFKGNMAELYHTKSSMSRFDVSILRTMLYTGYLVNKIHNDRLKIVLIENVNIWPILCHYAALAHV